MDNAIMDIQAARTWFRNLDGEMMIATPVVTTTGAAHERLLGFSESPVEIFHKNNAYRLKVQLPSRCYDLCGKVTLTIQGDHMGLTVSGEINSGQILGPSTIPVVLNRRTRIQRISPHADFSISFNLPEPLDPGIISFSIWANGLLELFFAKPHAMQGQQPPAAG